jgi:hypothetical protein
MLKKSTFSFSLNRQAFNLFERAQNKKKYKKEAEIE